MQSLALNTKKTGRVTVFTFKQGRKYISVCLELDIVKEGMKAVELNKEMLEAVMGHVESICKGGLSDDLLNRPAPAMYWNKYWIFVDGLNRKHTNVTKRNTQVGTVNILPIADLCAA